MTGHLPVFEAIEEDALRAAARVRGLFEPRHRAADAAPMTPATMPVNLATAVAATQGETMDLATIEDDFREDVTKGIDYASGLLQRLQQRMPAIVSTVDAVGGSTVGKLLEVAAGKFLPPGIEEEFLSIAGRYFSTWGQAAVSAAPAQPAAPAAP